MAERSVSLKVPMNCIFSHHWSKDVSCSSSGGCCGQGLDGELGPAGQKGNMGQTGVTGPLGKSRGHMTPVPVTLFRWIL